MLALQSWKYCTKTRFTIAASDPYYTGVTVANLNRKIHHGALFCIADGSDPAPVTGKDGAVYTFTDIELDNLTASQIKEVGKMSSLLHIDAAAQGERIVPQGERVVPLVRKRPRPETPPTSLPSWPAPEKHGGFSVVEEDTCEDTTPALKRRKPTPKPASPTYLLDDILLDNKSLVVYPSAETILHNTLALHTLLPQLKPSITRFLTPTLPKPSADILPIIILPVISEIAESEPLCNSSSPPNLSILKPTYTLPSNFYDLFPFFIPKPSPSLDTDSDCDQEPIPSPPHSPINISSSPEPSPAHPSTSDKPSSSADTTNPSSSNPSYRGVPSMPYPPGLEAKFDYALGMLDKISRQLSTLQTQQQAGFAELQLRHDTGEINLDAVARSNETTAVTASRILLGEVRKVFTRGTPRHRSETDDAAWRRKMTMEANDARRLAEAAVQGERNMRALNVRLYQEINDLRRQLHQETFLNVPVDRLIPEELSAVEGNNKRMDEAAAREEEAAARAEEVRHQTEQDRLEKLKGAMYLSD